MNELSKLAASRPAWHLDAYFSALIDRLYRLLRLHDIEHCELGASIFAFAWGIWLMFMEPLVPSLGRFSGPWGMMLTLLGSIQFASVISQNIPARGWASLLACGVWAFFSAFIFLGDGSSLLCPTALLLSVASFWGYLRVSWLNAGKDK